MWPFGKSTPKPTQDETRDRILAGFADVLELSWSPGGVRSVRSLKDHKELIKLVFVNRLRQLGRGHAYDVTWAAAMCVPEFQEMSEAEEAQLKQLSTLLEGQVDKQTLAVEAGRLSAGLEVVQVFTDRIGREREAWVRDLAQHGLTSAGSRY